MPALTNYSTALPMLKFLTYDLWPQIAASCEMQKIVGLVSRQKFKSTCEDAQSYKMHYSQKLYFTIYLQKNDIID